MPSLRDLNAKLEGTLADGVLHFDCPLSHPHKIRVPVNATGEEKHWKATGVFPDTLTLTPSIHAHSAAPNDMDLRGEAYKAAAECGWHGFIRNGEAVNA